MKMFTDIRRQQSLYIRQLEEKLSELLMYTTGQKHSEINCGIEQMRQWVDDWRQDVWNRDRKELEKVTRERDAAVEDLRGFCAFCAHKKECLGPECVWDTDEQCKQCICKSCFDGNHWEWSGPEEE